MADVRQTSPPDREWSPGDHAGLTVHAIVSSRWAQNCYLVQDHGNRAALVIDPGYGSSGEVARRLSASGCRLDYVVLTHEHHDHIGNLNELRARFGPRVIASELVSNHLTDSKRNLSAFYPGMGYSAARADLLVETVECPLAWSGHAVSFHRTPGHTEGSICIEIGGALFTGDTLIKGVKTVVKLPGGDRAALSRTLDFIFSAFPATTMVFPGHGEIFPLGATTRSEHQ